MMNLLMPPKTTKETTMFISNKIKIVTLIGLLLATTVMAQTPYDEGQKAVRDGNWDEAITHFEEAISSDQNSDASMYWRAYALFEIGRDKEAGLQIREILRRKPEGRWSKEAQMLLIEHQDSEAFLSDETGPKSIMDAELRMYALSQLMERNPERATPMVLDTVRNSTSEKVRKDALFVLGMSDSPLAQKAIAEFAHDGNNPELQALAINILGMSASKAALAELASLYAETDDPDVKRAVIHAHIVSDESSFLLEVLRQESDPELQTDIIHSLGAMDATTELRTLYPTLTDRRSKEAAIQAFSIAGDNQTLSEIVATETDPVLRRAGIRGLAIADDGDSAELMQSLYQQSTDKNDKMAILEALIILDDGSDLALKVVRDETDPELQQAAIRVLGVLDATDELADLYQSMTDLETRRVILDSMAISDGTDDIIKVLETETDTELRAAAIRSLVISDEASASGYLLDLYPNASRPEKEAVIQSMMMMDDASGLIGLLKQEDDSELKRQMIQTLTVMETEESDAYLFELLEEEQ